MEDVGLPVLAPDDIVVTPATRAYGYAMANKYNGVPRPPVIFVASGNARVVFFFSSRRRHTRYWRDWSSYVCSSELLDQDIVHQSGMNIAIKEAIEGAAAVAGIDDFVDCMGQSAVTNLVSHRVGKHAGLKLRVEASIPRCEALRQIGHREDLRHAAQQPAL